MENSATFMSLRPQLQSSLLRLLMVVEWILLGLVAIAQIVVTMVNHMPALLILNGLGLGSFAVLGLAAPSGWISKLIYTSAEFGLLFLLGLLGNIPLPAMLFIVLVIRNCLLWSGKSRVIVTWLAFIGYLLLHSYRTFNHKLLVQIPLDQIGTVWLGGLVIFGLVILFLHLLVDAALKELKVQKQLTQANARLRKYALRVEELATAQERNRIARDIHDSLGHSLTVFSIHLEAALRLLKSNPAQVESLLLEVKQLNAKTLQEVRQSVTALRSDPLQERALPDAIAYLVKEFQQSTGILPNYEIQLKSPLSQELSVVIYRIVQESLTNICKYAAATEVSISIVQSATDIQVSVQDNGKGFELSQNTTGFGLQGMQERALALEGKLEIITAPNQGCCVNAMFTL